MSRKDSTPTRGTHEKTARRESSKRGTKGAPEDGLSAYQETANKLADLLSDASISETIKNALVADLRDFAGQRGGIYDPEILRAVYPLLCERAGHDPLGETVAALCHPRKVEPLPVGVPVSLKRVKWDGGDFTCDTRGLERLGIGYGDVLRDDYCNPNDPPKTGDVVALQVMGCCYYVGILQVRGDKVLLFSASPGEEVHRFDRNKDKVKLVMRVASIFKNIPRGHHV